MEISLPPELEKLVTQHMEAGGFSSPDEVIRAGLLSLSPEAEPGFVYSTEDELYSKLAAGIEQLDAGEGIPLNVVREDLLRKAADRPSQNA